MPSDSLDQLEARVKNAVDNLAKGMIAGGDTGDMLPLEDISVTKTSDGVTVKFIGKPKAKKARKVTDHSDDADNQL